MSIAYSTLLVKGVMKVYNGGMNNKDIALKMREQMQESGIYFRHLAKKLGIGIAGVSSFFSPRHDPQKVTIKRYLDALKTFPTWPKDFEKCIEKKDKEESQIETSASQADVQQLRSDIKALGASINNKLDECFRRLEIIMKAQATVSHTLPGKEPPFSGSAKGRPAGL